MYRQRDTISLSLPLSLSFSPSLHQTAQWQNENTGFSVLLTPTHPLSLTKTFLVTAKRMNALLCIRKCVSLHGRPIFTPLRPYRLPGSSHLIGLSCHGCVPPGVTWPMIRRLLFINTWKVPLKSGGGTVSLAKHANSAENLTVWVVVSRINLQKHSCDRNGFLLNSYVALCQL